MSKINKLKKYQFKKFGKCLSCREPVPAESCVIQCPNCGYEDSWDDVQTYLDDKGDSDDEGKLDNEKHKEVESFFERTCLE